MKLSSRIQTTYSNCIFAGKILVYFVTASTGKQNGLRCKLVIVKDNIILLSWR